MKILSNFQCNGKQVIKFEFYNFIFPVICHLLYEMNTHLFIYWNRFIVSIENGLNNFDNYFTKGPQFTLTRPPNV